MKAKQTTKVGVYIVIIAAVFVILTHYLSVPDNTVSPSEATFLPGFTLLHGIALGAIVVVASGIIIFLNTRYGPLITFTSKVQSQQSTEQFRRRPAWRSPIIIFIAVAVVVLLYQWFLADGNRPSPYHEPPSQETNSFSFPPWFDLLLPIGAGGAVVVSLVHVALAHYGIIPFNEQVRTVHSQEIASPDELRPPQVLSLANELTNLGFVQLGQFMASLPSGRELNQSLLFISKEHTVAVWIGWARWGSGAGLVFTSYFPDNALLETRYRYILRIRHPNYQASGNVESLTAAWEQHRHNLEVFSKQHGEPVTLDSARSCLDWNKRTFQFLGRFYWQALTNQALAFPGAWLTFNLALLGTILILMVANTGSMGLMALCVLPVIAMTLIPELLLVINTARMLRKMA